MRSMFFVGLGIFYFLGCLQADDSPLFSYSKEEETPLYFLLEARHSSDSEHKKRLCPCHRKREKHGPTGPTGPTGPGAFLAENFGSFYGNDVVTVSGPLSFPNEQVTPVGIVPNLGNTIFTVSNPGVYSIEWTATANLAGNQSTAAVSLTLAVNGSTTLPDPIGITLNQFPASTITLIQTGMIAGQTTILVKDPTPTIELIASFQGSATITNRTFSITQIAQ